MKLICQQGELLSALNTVTRAAAARSTMPTLECVYMEAGESALRLICTDIQMGIDTSLPAQVMEQGRLLLPARLLLEIVKKLPEGDVTITVNDSLLANIKAHGSRTNMQGMPADEFPALPEIGEANTLLVDQSQLRDMVRQTVFAIAVEETRPVLTGCLIETQGSEMTMVALDGFRMALRRTTLDREFPAVRAVVPGKYLNEISRMLGDDETSIALGFGDTHLMLDLGYARVTVRLLDGEYIKYSQLIPADQQTIAKLSRDELSDCVDRASLMAREGKNNLIRLHLEEDKMVITSNSELGDIYEELSIELQGKPLDIAFNVRYVSDVLRNLSDEELIMRFNSPVSPCTLTPLEGNDYLYLLLPVRIYGA